jgi:SAM-dependent methyltransferase
MYALGALYRAGVYARIADALIITPKEHRRLMRFWTEELDRPAFRRREFDDELAKLRDGFIATEIPDSMSDEDHFAVWKRPEVLYHLLFSAQKLGRYPFLAHRFMPYIPKNGHICEYGAGAAPITYAIRRFYQRRWQITATIVDIPSWSFDYARWTFADTSWVDCVELTPHDDAPLRDAYDTIICNVVFEHLPRPMAVAQHFHDSLKPGGYLVFDYIESVGTGLDTKTALRNRTAVLQWIADHFQGDIDPRSAGPWMVQRA